MNRSSDLRDFGIKEQFKPNFKNAPRDGPSDIQGGGGLGFFLTTSYFFLSLHNKLFFSKVNCNKFFIFLKK